MTGFLKDSMGCMCLAYASWLPQSDQQVHLGEGEDRKRREAKSACIINLFTAYTQLDRPIHANFQEFGALIVKSQHLQPANANFE